MNNETLIHLDIGPAKESFQNGDIISGRQLACGGIAIPGMGTGLGHKNVVTCKGCYNVIHNIVEVNDEVRTPRTDTFYF